MAVLDTGIDKYHSDLVYDPECSASFVSGESVQDGGDPDTHVARMM